MVRLRNAGREGSSAARQWLFLVAAKVLSRFSFPRQMMRNLGQCAEFVQWLNDKFSQNPRLLVTREAVWKKMIAALNHDRPIVALEFGVAWGYTTQWWLERLKSRAVVWHGFDRFTGLPRSWRHYTAGAFDAGGRPPDLDDPRVRWHVGDAERTLPAINLKREPGSQWIILFDLDIYEPTAFVWTYLSGSLRAGDLIYFDEAFDEDERRVLNELVLNHPDIRTSLFASSPISLVLRVEDVKPHAGLMKNSDDS